ncbi:MAG: CsgG/HfaB family protein [Lentisphaeria bacterium]|nr:CsgG/HfaB family protein [Lentisphaeria bacterium]
MKKMIKPVKMMLATLAFLGILAPVYAQEPTPVYPTAIFPFQERGNEVAGYGEQVGDLLFALLAVDPELYLVDRADMKKMLDEAELNLSGMVTPGQATQVGQLTGAKIIVTGSVMAVGNKTYVVAKIIGTETTRVLGASVKGDPKDDIDALVEQLSEKVAATIRERAVELVAKPIEKKDLVAELKEKLGDAKRPPLFITIRERHVGQATIDPAAETEVTLLATETGFEVVDPKTGRRKDASIVLEGEGFSEFAMRKGNLVSVKARLELKAIDTATDKVIAIDRQTAVVVDLTEQIAGKAALEKAAREIAARLLPKLVEKER